MQKLVRLVLAAAVIGAAVWGWRVLFPSPQKVIRSRLLKLAATASFEPKDGEIVRAYQAQKLTDFFTPDATLDVDIRGFGQRSLGSRDELQQAALAYMHVIRGLKIELIDINITLDPDKQTAVANLTGKATVSGDSDFYVQELKFKLKKVDGQWLIYKVETVKTLSLRSAGLAYQVVEHFGVGTARRAVRAAFGGATWAFDRRGFQKFRPLNAAGYTAARRPHLSQLRTAAR